MKAGIFSKIIFFSLCAAFVRSQDSSKPESAEAAEEEKVTARELLESGTRMIPLEPLVLKGSLIVRKQRGIELARHPFQLMTDWGKNPPSAECLLLSPEGTSVVERAVLTRPLDGPAEIKVYKGLETSSSESVSFAGRIRGTDMTWMDISLDFLWWEDVRFDDKPSGKCRTGRNCYILIAASPESVPGCSAVRIWIDKRLKCVMQTEQLDPQGNPVRRMWVQKIREYEDKRWMISHMEIETLGSGHRTKLLVNDIAKP
ncbi:MAG: outer membrane lipoprotein-sorting protein [Kiritimatiellia bacterium]